MSQCVLGWEMLIKPPAGGALRASLFALLFTLARDRRHISLAIVNSFQSMLKKEFSSCLPSNISLWRPGAFYSFSETHKDEWEYVTGTYVKSKATGVASAFCWDSQELLLLLECLGTSLPLA